MSADPKPGSERLLAESAELSRAAHDFTATFVAARVTGVDGSGQVEIRMASNGSPDQINVSAGWTRYLEPSQLGAAVIDAAEDAARTTTRQWSSSVDSSGWLGRVGDVASPAAGGTSELPGSGLPTGAPEGSELGKLREIGLVREVNELAEMAIRALQDATIASEKTIAALQQPGTGEGTDDSRHVQVTISGGQLIGCRIDERWAARHDGHTIGAALTHAARRAVAARPAPFTLDRGVGDQLLADVLATQRYDSKQAAPRSTGLDRQEQDR